MNAMNTSVGADRKLSQVYGFRPWLIIESAQRLSFYSVPTIAGIAQLNHDRVDCENNFNELKKLWGWDGFTIYDLHRCQLSARHVAMVYNGWSLFAMLADPRQRREAITGRPRRLHSLGWGNEHAGQTTLTITSTHAEQDTANATVVPLPAALPLMLGALSFIGA